MKYSPISLKQLYNEIQSQETPRGQLLAQLPEDDFDQIYQITAVLNEKYNTFREFSERLLKELTTQIGVTAIKTWPEFYEWLDKINQDIQFMYLDDEIYILTENIRNISEIELKPEDYTVAFTFIPEIAREKEPVVVSSYPVTMFHSKQEFLDFIEHEIGSYEDFSINCYILKIIFTNWKTKHQYEYRHLSDKLEDL